MSNERILDTIKSAERVKEDPYYTAIDTPSGRAVYPNSVIRPVVEETTGYKTSMPGDIAIGVGEIKEFYSKLKGIMGSHD